MKGLSITRNIGNSFYIGKDIKVTIMSIRGRQATIVINAPKSYNIVREEILDRFPLSLEQGLQNRGGNR